MLPDDIYFSPEASKVEERQGLSHAIGRWVFRLLSPANILVTDPQGRRTGYDPTTNSVLQEIPDTFYSGPSFEPQHIDFRNLVGGTWNVQVIGTGTGPYTFLAESIDKDSHIIIPASGNITPGAVVIYEFSNPGDGSQPTLTQTVSIDVKPGADLPPINLVSDGVTPVAILSGDAFDATTVDPSSVKFGPNGATSTQNGIEDVNGDGRPDLVLHFRTQQTGVKEGDTRACLTGKTKSGINIQGCDSIRIVGG